MPEQFFHTILDNGLTVLVQPMEQVSSAAMTLAIPAGCAFDPVGMEGAAAVATEWLMRGAGRRDTRALNDALDALGASHRQSVHSHFLSLSSSQLGRHLEEVLTIFADVARRPRLEDGTFDPSRALTLQDLQALEDEPARRTMLLLRDRYYPRPLGRVPQGTAESLQSMTASGVREHLARALTPRGAILAVAGSADPEKVRAAAERLLGDWTGPEAALPQLSPPTRGVTHIPKPSAQTHIGIAYESVICRDDRYYAARLAETVLSGGMSSRLFTEVREKRGLAYHVDCQHHSLRDRAGMFAYAASRPELARETFDVTLAEIRRLAEGIEPGELQRARVQAKSSAVMHNESTSSRSGALVSDWYHLGRLRSLEEIVGAVDAVTAGQVLEYLAAYPPDGMTVLVIGPDPIVPDAETASAE